jgi:hypothetical protein
MDLVLGGLWCPLTSSLAKMGERIMEGGGDLRGLDFRKGVGEVGGDGVNSSAGKQLIRGRCRA